MTDPNDDIIKQIKSVLQHYEEPYDEGSWERFAATHTTPSVRKKPVIAMWVAAAAAAIVGVILFARIFNSASVTDAPAELPTAVTEQSSDSNSKNKAVVKALPQTDNSAVITEPDEATTQQPSMLKQSPAATTAFNNTPQLPAISPATPAFLPPQQGVTPGAPIAKQEKPQEQKVDFWRNKAIDNNAANNANAPKKSEVLIASTPPAATERRQAGEKNSRWQPSLYVSPLFGELGINMGYGVSLGYAINDKIRISSGIAHTKISASRGFDAGGGPEASFASAIASAPPGDLASSGAKNSLVTYSSSTAYSSQVRTLQQVNASLSGIDIPVEVNYSINKKLYATAGVSALVVINDNKTYTFSDSRNVKISVETSKGALKEDRSVTFNEQSMSNQPSQIPTENTPLLGFYNFSLGYRQKISDKNAVSLEPFIKVPMKNVTQQNLKYMGTGIRLKFDL